MGYQFNPFTGNFDIVGSSSTSYWTESGTNLSAPTTDTVTVGAVTTSYDTFTVNTEGNAGATINSTYSGQATVSQTGNDGSDQLGGIAGVQLSLSQTFTTSSEGIMYAATMYINSVTGSPTGAITCRIETTSGGAPTGTLADANATVDVTPSGTGSITFTFPSSFTLAAGQYAIVISAASQSNNNYWNMAVKSGNPYAGGQESEYFSGSWHAQTTVDMYFYALFSGASPGVSFKNNGTLAARIWTDGTNSDRLTITTGSTDQVLLTGASFSGNAVTGSGKMVAQTSPTLTTPTIGAAAGTSLTLSAPGTSSTDVPNLTSTNTFTNKRITKRVVTASDATSITPNTDNADITYQANTQSTGTLTINADGGTPTNGQSWLLKMKSTNVQTFSWNAVYVGGDTALPTATTGSSQIDYYSFIYDTVDSKWHFTGKATNF